MLKLKTTENGSTKSTEDFTILVSQVDQWVTSVSHEIKNSLTAVILATALLKRKNGTCPLTSSLINSIENSTQSMERIIADLLDFTSMQDSKFSVTKEWIDSELLGLQLIASQNSLATKTKNKLEVSLTGQIYCDPFRISQVLINLTNNALKFTKNGTVSVFGECTASGYRFRIVDNGSGISVEDLPKIFGRFWQANDEQKKLGTGLGLAIIQGITKSHQGQIRVESKLGQGTEFFLDLPNEFPEPVIEPVAKISAKMSADCRSSIRANSKLIEKTITTLASLNSKHSSSVGLVKEAQRMSIRPDYQ